MRKRKELLSFFDEDHSALVTQILNIEINGIKKKNVIPDDYTSDLARQAFIKAGLYVHYDPPIPWEEWSAKFDRYIERKTHGAAGKVS